MAKGKHSLTFGFTYQFLNLNNANPATYTGVLDLGYNANSTANFNANSATLSTTTGYGYASYLLGAVGGLQASVCSPSPRSAAAISRQLRMSRTTGRSPTS